MWNSAWEITSENGFPVLFENTPFIRALKTGQPQTEVLIIRLRNEENRWLHFSSQPLFEDNSSEAYSVVSNIADLTYEKKLILEIKEKKALFRSFMDQTPNQV